MSKKISCPFCMEPMAATMEGGFYCEHCDGSFAADFPFQEQADRISDLQAHNFDRPVVVTRHPALVEYLRELGLIGRDVRVIAHARPEDVKGRKVFGVLPLHLAAEAAEVVAISLNLPPELRGQELSLEQVRLYAKEPRRYRVIDEG